MPSRGNPEGLRIAGFPKRKIIGDWAPQGTRRGSTQSRDSTLGVQQVDRTVPVRALWLGSSSMPSRGSPEGLRIAGFPKRRMICKFGRHEGRARDPRSRGILPFYLRDRESRAFRNGLSLVIVSHKVCVTGRPAASAPVSAHKQSGESPDSGETCTR